MMLRGDEVEVTAETRDEIQTEVVRMHWMELWLHKCIGMAFRGMIPIA